MNSGFFRSAPLAVAFVATSLASAQAGMLYAQQAAFPNSSARSALSGTVLNRDGEPQIGVRVALLDRASQVVAETFTDGRGRYHLPRLSAGIYQIEASDALFLPTLRSNLRLLEGSKMVVNLTLSTINQALQWLPATPQNASAPRDDWSWTLRLSTNRPLLRMLDPATARKLGGSGLVAVEQGGAGEQTAEVSLRSGEARFGEGGAQEEMVWSREATPDRTLLLAASSALGPGDAQRIASSAGYVQQLSPDRTVTTVVTFADRPAIEGAEGSGLTTLRVRTESTVQIGPLATVNAGMEMVAARLAGLRAAADSHPFGGLMVHAGGATVTYRAATAPTMTDAANLEEEAEQDNPAVLASAGQLLFEAGLHQQMDVDQELAHGMFGLLSAQMGVFHDSLAHPILEAATNGGLGGGEAAVDSQDVLYDPGTGILAVSGKGYSGGGVMALLHDQLSPDTWLTLRYALGEAETLPPAATGQSLGESLGVRRSPMAALAGGTRLPATHTSVRASYRWQPVGTITEVAPFVREVPDAYLGLSLRQPLGTGRLGASHVEAIVDVRNLLAQGYRPFLSQDGTVVYFAQAQRCIAAGLRFSF